MTDYPIIFSASMIRALLDGRKSMTRRLAYSASGKPSVWLRLHENWQAWRQGISRADLLAGVTSGDRLWVRENLRVGSETLLFAADDSVVPKGSFAWQGWFYRYGERRIPSIHMPRWASRLTLVVTDTKMERLQEISEEDAINEGLIAQNGDGGAPGAGYKWKGTGYHGGTMSDRGMCFHTPHWDSRPGCSCRVGGPSPAQCAFRELWESLHGPGSWSANPELVCISFRVVKANIDAMEKAA